MCRLRRTLLLLHDQRLRLRSPTQNSTGQTVPAATPVPQSARPALPPYAPNGVGPRRDTLGSTYIPVDSIVYPMALRLYSMGYLDTAFINMRPWTRRSLLHMLEQSSPAIIASGNDQAIDLLAKLDHYIASEGAEDATTEVHFDRGNVYGVQSVYTRILGISGQTLNDSYHLGQTISARLWPSLRAGLQQHYRLCHRERVRAFLALRARRV